MLGVCVFDFAQKQGKGRNERAYLCLMLVGGEAPNEELAQKSGATRPLVGSSPLGRKESRERARERERDE